MVRKTRRIGRTWLEIASVDWVGLALRSVEMDVKAFVDVVRAVSLLTISVAC